MEALFQPRVQEYIVSTVLRESSVAQALREYTLTHVDQSQMLSHPEQMQFVAWILRLMKAERVIEVGVYTGYGTLVIAEALPSWGRVIACDKNDR